MARDIEEKTLHLLRQQWWLQYAATGKLLHCREYGGFAHQNCRLETKARDPGVEYTQLQNHRSMPLGRSPTSLKLANMGVTPNNLMRLAGLNSSAVM